MLHSIFRQVHLAAAYWEAADCIVLRYAEKEGLHCSTFISVHTACTPPQGSCVNGAHGSQGSLPCCEVGLCCNSYPMQSYCIWC